MKNRTVKLSKRKILKGIAKGMRPEVLVYKELDSTNTHAKRLLKDNKISCNTLILAEHQSAGRGRCGRDFYSPMGEGLYMSLCFIEHTSLSPVFLSTLCAVAVSEAIEELTGLDAQIKWVNDIYISDKKACGILCEATPLSDGFGIILGIGVNTTTKDFPKFENNTPTTVGNIDRNVLCAKIYEKILFYKSNGDSYKEKYKARSYLDGKNIKVYTQNGKYTARALGIDESCGLIILPDGQTEPIILTSGEVSVRVIE